MRIRRLFSYIYAINMAAFILLGGGILVIESREYWFGTKATHNIETFSLGLKVMEKISYERGPTNALLGDPLPHDDLKLKRFRLAREASDQAYSALAEALKNNHAHALTLSEIETAKTNLNAARKRADTLIDTPLEQRDADTVSAVIGSLFDIIDTLSSPVSRLGTIAEHSDPEIGGALIVARLAADLRENPGRIGSELTAPLVSHAPLSRQDLSAIFQTRGKIELYANILRRRAAGFMNEDTVPEALKNLDSQYMINGLQYADLIVKRGMDTGNYAVTPAEFAASYVPNMASIVQVRDVFLQVATNRADAHQRQARNALLLVLLGAIILMTTYFTLAAVLKRRIISPLITATDVIIKLANRGQIHPNGPIFRYDEIVTMVNAVETLEASIKRKEALEKERNDLMSLLEQQANTDPLTKLCNRRSFFGLGEREFSQARRRQSVLSIAMIDVDHFKVINDTFGHPAGDRVLVALSQLLARNCREGDVVGRIGGEEFAIVFVDSPYQQSQDAAERLRIQAENLIIESDSPGTPVMTMTISIGLATAMNEDADFASVLHRADKALYLAKKNGRNRLEFA